MRIVAAVMLALCAVEAVRAQDAPPSEPPDDGQLSLSFPLQSAFVHQLDTEIDGGGSFHVNRLAVRPAVEWRIGRQFRVSAAVGYDYDQYDFSGAGGLGALDPWDDIHTLQAGAMLRWMPDDTWTVFAAPTIRFSAEHGADLDDGVHGGGFVGFSYRFSDRLTLGPGVGALTQIEDDVSVFPVILIDWKITDDLTLRTGRGLGASQGPGLVLAWAFAEHWELTVGGRYESRRFRLADDGPVPGGVGEESSFPLYGGITWAPSEDLSLSVLGGLSFAGSLELDSPSGAGVAKQDYDPAGFFGVILTGRF